MRHKVGETVEKDHRESQENFWKILGSDGEVHYLVCGDSFTMNIRIKIYKAVHLKCAIFVCTPRTFKKITH